MWRKAKCEHCGDIWFYHTKFRPRKMKGILKGDVTKILCEDCEDILKITTMQRKSS